MIKGEAFFNSHNEFISGFMHWGFVCLFIFILQSFSVLDSQLTTCLKSISAFLGTCLKLTKQSVGAQGEAEACTASRCSQWTHHLSSCLFVHHAGERDSGDHIKCLWFFFTLLNHILSPVLQNWKQNFEAGGTERRGIYGNLKDGVLRQRG